MIVTKVEHVGNCKSTEEGETYRFFNGMPPLPPGDTPDPGNKHLKAGGKHEERFIPEEMGTGTHRVYRVKEGHGTLMNEVAVFAKPGAVPMCWLVSADKLLHGREDIQEVFPEIFIIDGEEDPTGPINAVCEGLQRLGASYGTKYALLIDKGQGWSMQETNDPHIMRRVREALDAS
jgi:hypothetical protein